LKRCRVRIYIDVFVMGITLSWGPCLFFCAPILVPYIAATQKGWFKGFRATLTFSLSRIVPYVILSIISATVGQYLIRNFYGSKAGLIIHILASSFVCLLGMIILIGKSPHLHICQSLSKHIHLEGTKGMILLGFLVGISPCIPLFGVLTYIAFASKNFLDGILLGLIFGAGTLISPLILFGSLAGGIPLFLLKKPLIYKTFRYICGLMLVYLGIGMMVKIFL